MDIVSILDFGRLGLFAFIASIGVAVMMRYLQKERASSSSSDKQIEEIRNELKRLRNLTAHRPEELEKYISEIKYQLDEVQARQAGISEDHQQELIEKLRKSITSESAQDVLNEIKQKVVEEEKNRTRFELVEETFQPTISRLKDELFSLSKRGNLNLSIGIMITVVGLGLLAMFVLSFPNSQKDMASFFIDFFPSSEKPGQIYF